MMSSEDAAGPLPAGEASFRRILANHLARYPLMQVQDLYKLVFQAAMGAEHAVPDRAAARAWFAREVRHLADGPPEPLVEPLSADERIVRVNLRPFLASHGDTTVLLNAFLSTARAYHGTETTLRQYWGYAEDMTEGGLLPFPTEALRSFFRQMQIDRFPAVRHSAVYSAAYHPAYRVVLREFLPIR